MQLCMLKRAGGYLEVVIKRQVSIQRCDNLSLLQSIQTLYNFDDCSFLPIIGCAAQLQYNASAEQADGYCCWVCMP